jgi:hypothetical protein
MAFNGSGVYSLPSTTVTPAVTDTTIDASEFNTFTADLEAALSLCCTNDGQTVSPTFTTPKTDNLSAATTNGNLVLAGNGTGGVYGGVNTHASSPFATTSGASVAVSGIPAWAKRITISLYRVSSDGTADALSMQVGDAGGLHATGYNSASGRINGTDTCGNEAAGTAFILNSTAIHTASSVYSGIITIILEDATNFNYSYSSIIADSGLVDNIMSAGSVSLDTAMTQFSLDISAGAFDAGSFSVHYEG